MRSHIHRFAEGRSDWILRAHVVAIDSQIVAVLVLVKRSVA
ncbi:hypothetical protein [Paraburkholderia aromaticivorans]|nr:hypothetical protein [Paraburkholderia aromaticivorans]